MLIPYVLMLRRLDATLDSLPNLKKYADTVKARPFRERRHAGPMVVS